MVARREWTRNWYDYALNVHDLVTSAAVLTELQKGNFPGKQAAISMIASLTCHFRLETEPLFAVWLGGWLLNWWLVLLRLLVA